MNRRVQGRLVDTALQLADDAYRVVQTLLHRTGVLGQHSFRDGRVAGDEDLGDLAQRNVQLAQPAQDSSIQQLIRCVDPISGGRVDFGGYQHALLVIRAQRLDRQRTGSGERADAQEGNAHD